MPEPTGDTLYTGDCIKLLGSWPEACVDLAFADPPFNIGYVYDKYHDDRPDEEYVEWTRAWMAAVQRVLKPGAGFYIAIGDEFAADLRLVGRQLGLALRNWIIWHYTFGQNAQTKFARSHTHIFYFVNGGAAPVFNDHLLRYPSARHTEYQDLRANPRGRLPDDVWSEFPRVCGTFKERAGFHGCQMPEALLMRIILASSNAGDLVLDPFNGSGTTAAAAKRLGRRYVTIDVSKDYIAHTRERLKQIEAAPRVDAGGWPPLHTEFLLQIYRETNVAVDHLLPNGVALQVVAGALAARAGQAYSPEAVATRLEQLAAAGQLPKLPNDRPFVARSHRVASGKRYERKVVRRRARRTG